MARRQLTTMQRRVMGFLTVGLTDAQMAARLGVDEVTVRGHIRRLCRVHAVSNRTDLMRVVKDHRIHHLEHLIEHTLDSMAACPCPCCDQNYWALYNGMREDYEQ